MNKDIFENYEIVLHRKSPPKIIGYQIILIVSIILFLSFSIFIRLPNKTTSIGTVIINKGGNYVSTILEKTIIDGHTLQTLDINGKSCDFKVIKVNDDKINYQLTLKINTDVSITNEEVVFLTLGFDNETLLKRLSNFIKKGLM